MPNRKNVDFKAIEEWALAHGFQRTTGNNLVAPYGTGQVQIEFLIRDIRVTAISGDHRQRLVTAHPRQLHIDENDMLQGAGLFSQFYTNYRDDYRERNGNAEMPVWFSEKVRSMVAEHIAMETNGARTSTIGG